MRFRCRHCSAHIDLKEAAATAPHSWPTLQAFWSGCPSCGKGNHIRMEAGAFAVINVLDSPGPTWEYVERLRDPTVSFRSDHDALHVSIGAESYSIAARP